MDQEDLARQLNENMVDILVQKGIIRHKEVERAFREILRHKLLPPDISPAEVYQDRTIHLKKASAADLLPQGRTMSSSTMPGLLAAILEAAELQPGMRALQIGSGPGYLAALMSHLVGDSGSVATVEIDPEIAEKTRERLSAAGCGNIRCVSDDGYSGFGPLSPYDRIIATASCADVPPAWIDQLTDDGLMILPFSFSQRTSLYPMISFRKEGNGLIGKIAGSLATVGFIPLYGPLVTYPVLYEKAISNLETRVGQHLGLRAIDGNRALFLTVLLEIARSVENDPSGLPAMDSQKISSDAIDIWERLGKPPIDGFRFLLLPKGQGPESCTWKFRKERHDLFVRVKD